GSLPIPTFIADFALERIMARFSATASGSAAKDIVKSVKLSDAQMRLVYEWREDLVNRAREGLVSRKDQERFRAYSDRLFDFVENTGRRRNSIALSQLLPPMFALAKQRSSEGDAAKENRAAIITLAFFVFARDLSAI